MAKPNVNFSQKPKKGATASVGPIKGNLDGQPDNPALGVRPEPKVTGKDKAAQGDTKAVLEGQFAEIEKTLNSSHDGKKQPRQLRWALKSLDAAKDAALRHVQHNI